MLETLRSFGDWCTQSHFNHLRSLENALSPLSPEEWHHSSLAVAMVARKIFQASYLAVLEPLFGALALVGVVITNLTEKTATGFEAVLKDPNRWDAVDTSKKVFPKMMGVAISEYQYSGMNNCPHSQWAKFEKKHLPADNRSEYASDLWNRMDTHIERLVELGVNSFRFSIEWSKIEPEKGKFNEVAIQHYVEFVQKLKAAGITPMACFLHFSMPQWVEDEGGILSTEFPDHLARFAEKVFPYLSKEVKLWNTINEPEIQAFMGYLLGDFPPQHHSVAEMGRGLKHLLQAHCKVYEVLKAQRPEVQIGLVHNVLRYQAYRWWHPIERLTCHYLTKLTHDVVRDFLKTGVFDFKVPFLVHEKFTVEKVPNDFNGVNYYVRPLLKQVFSKEFMISTHPEGGEMTRMPFREDPEGLYEAIMEMPGPIYVTENGISARTDQQMNRYYDRSLYAVSKAMKDGADVRGYYAWSLAKNAEWAEGWDPQNFGLYTYNRNTQKYSLRPGAKRFKQMVQLAQKQERAV